jgi:hypothetical protein
MASINTMRYGELALLCAFALAAHSVNAAGLYKWIDERGGVHYSDQLPPEAADKGTVVLDKQGRQVKKIEPAPSPAELKAKEAEDERQKAMARARDDRARKDIALLQSYTSAEEIDLARGRALSAVETQLKSAETYNAELAKQLAELEKQKAALAGKPVPFALENAMSSVSDEMARQARVIAQKKDEMAAISARYESDKRHWQEIKSDQARTKAAEDAAGNAPASAPAKPTAAKTPAGNSATTTR